MKLNRLIIIKKAVEVYSNHSYALEALGIYYLNIENEYEKSIELFKQALKIDPLLFHSNIYLALSYSESGEEKLARRYFEKVINMSNINGYIAIYANEMAKWGFWDDAEKLFNKIIKKTPDCRFTQRLYKIFLLNVDNPNYDDNIVNFRNILSEKDLSFTSHEIWRYAYGLKIINFTD